jgi:hypothetical protein
VDSVVPPSHVMPARLVVPKTPQQPSVPPPLPLYKNARRLTRPESTLPQVLIPLNFNSCIGNTYKKPQGGAPHANPKVLQLVTPTAATFCHAERSEESAFSFFFTSDTHGSGRTATPHNSNRLIHLLHNPLHTRGWGPSPPSTPKWDSQSWLSLPVFHESLATDHGSQFLRAAPRTLRYLFSSPITGASATPTNLSAPP